MRASILRPKTEHDKFCSTSPTPIIEICTNCDLPGNACGKRVCKERYSRLYNEIKEKKKNELSHRQAKMG